ncbi:MAG: hypothetical protein NTU51_10665 [Bacteroidetes bacterium]|nr:hypothetical protein [Bacteroidota bacterium]
MKYFISKVVTTSEVTLGFVAPHQPLADGPQIVHYAFDRIGDEELHGLDYQGELDVPSILALQHQECQVEEVTFASVETRLKACRFSREINEEVVAQIRSRYSIDDELKIMKQDPTSGDYVAMMAWIDSCRSDGNAKKVALGLLQA